MNSETIITALFYTGATLVVFTAAHVFLWGIIWANDATRHKIAKHRGLGRVFRMLFFHDRETLRKHEEEIHQFISKLEAQDYAEKHQKKAK
jgi:hypothetical protein